MKEFYKMSHAAVIAQLHSDEKNGLDDAGIAKSLKNYGKNVMPKEKKAPLIIKILDALLEPMMIILLVAFFATLFVSVVAVYSGGEFNYFECIGIAVAILLSVFLSLYMESRSEKAFSELKNLGGNTFVKVVRGGKVQKIASIGLVIGDIIYVDIGAKIPADCRIISGSDDLSVDESFLTGESEPAKKDGSKIYSSDMALAEQSNMLFSGSLVSLGSAVAIVVGVGEATELGKIAGELKVLERLKTPLSDKLDRLGKIIAVAGALCAAAVFALNFAILLIGNNVNFDSVAQIFVTSIVLIVAAVPEGLPTIVAVCLALNVVKMSGENALVKKMVACETLGSVSVICSDKTGTLTQNKMKVECICDAKRTFKTIASVGQDIKNNIIYNSSADIIYNEKTKNYDFFGSVTECAMLVFLSQNSRQIDYKYKRSLGDAVKVYPFSSHSKAMTTLYRADGLSVAYMKGAPERVAACCTMTQMQIKNVNTAIKKYQQSGGRVLAFAHKKVGLNLINLESEKLQETLESDMIFDGFVVIADPIRREVQGAVSDCARAGVKVKILTGDNVHTATAVGRKLKIIGDNGNGIYHASDIEGMKSIELDRVINDVKIVARSTPTTKLKIVQSLQRSGHVVAVTGDGVNDTPAICASDVGIAMGISGSEVCKEASDVVLLDDSFSTIIKSIKWGRGIFENLQRFILFQLTVNISAALVTICCLLLGIETPFTALQLLWINLIMDGLPALSLALEPISDNLLKRKPLKRNAPIITKNMAVRIIFFGVFISVVLVLQAKFNFLNIASQKEKTFIFCAFVLCQLCNAFNARALDKTSIFSSFFANKPMLFIMSATFILQIVFVQLCGDVFSVVPLSLLEWVKAFAIGISVVIISELAKLAYRKVF